MLMPELILTEGDGDRYQETGGLGTVYDSTNSSSSTVKAWNLKVNKQQYNKCDVERYGGTYEKNQLK